MLLGIVPWVKRRSGQITLLDQALKIEQAVSEAAYQMTPSFPGLGQGRCKCGSLKSLKFKWKDQPIPHPSFFC